MIEPYVKAAAGGVQFCLSFLAAWVWPLGALLVALIAGCVAWGFRRPDTMPALLKSFGMFGRAAGGWLLLAVGLAAGWNVFSMVERMARADMEWRESTTATSNPTPNAQPIRQFGPSVSTRVSRTYTRTLTLPPEFLKRIGTEGVGVLAPYLTDPTAENVTRLVDTYRRPGSDVIFSREATRLDEEPMPLAGSTVQVTFHRLPGRAFDLEFEARYRFRNSGTEAATTRFSFPLPEAGTVRDLTVQVSGESVEQKPGGREYLWERELQPGEQKEARVRYRALGGRQWSYSHGSDRRRSEEFVLQAASGGPVRFIRGSLPPTETAGSQLTWRLNNVVTAQQIDLDFPPDLGGRSAFFQALGALPIALVLFAVVGLATGGIRLCGYSAAQSVGALGIFCLGLGAAPVLSNYLGSVGGVLLGCSAAAAGAAILLPRPCRAAALVAFIPAACLSPTHTGLLLLVLGGTILALATRARFRQASAQAAA